MFNDFSFFKLVLITLFISILLIGLRSMYLIYSGHTEQSKTNTSISTIKNIGAFSFVFGLLGQLIGQYQAFKILKTTNASPTLLAEGFQVSLLPTIYGIIILTTAFILIFLVKKTKNRKH